MTKRLLIALTLTALCTPALFAGPGAGSSAFRNGSFARSKVSKHHEEQNLARLQKRAKSDEGRVVPASAKTDESTSFPTWLRMSPKQGRVLRPAR